MQTLTIVDFEALSAFFGQHISHDRHTLPHTNMAELVATLHAPVLFRTGWYDWGVNDAFATWELIQRAGSEPFRSNCRLFVAPSAHNMPGYHEGVEDHPELHHAYGLATNVELLRRWYEAVRHDEVDTWPTVIYYLMGANEWRVGRRLARPRRRAGPALPRRRRYPRAATSRSRRRRPTATPTTPRSDADGGWERRLIRLPAGSVDVSYVQARKDVLTYTTEPLAEDLDVVGPLRLVLYASSSALDTDFVARLTDVFPDGRAIQLQNGLLRARYRDVTSPPISSRARSTGSRSTCGRPRTASSGTPPPPRHLVLRLPSLRPSGASRGADGPPRPRASFPPPRPDSALSGRRYASDEELGTVD